MKPRENVMRSETKTAKKPQEKPATHKENHRTAKRQRRNEKARTPKHFSPSRTHPAAERSSPRGSPPPARATSPRSSSPSASSEPSPWACIAARPIPRLPAPAHPGRRGCEADRARLRGRTGPQARTPRRPTRHNSPHGGRRRAREPVAPRVVFRPRNPLHAPQRRFTARFRGRRNRRPGRRPPGNAPARGSRVLRGRAREEVLRANPWLGAAARERACRRRRPLRSGSGRYAPPPRCGLLAGLPPASSLGFRVRLLRDVPRALPEVSRRSRAVHVSFARPSASACSLRCSRSSFGVVSVFVSRSPRLRFVDRADRRRSLWAKPGIKTVGKKYAR